MLKSLRIQNFKAWKDTGEIRLAPLTVIFGANSAGKSSLGHLLLALKQTALSTDRRRALHLGDDNSLIDLGTFSECIHNHDLEQKLNFKLCWQLSEPLDIKNPQVRDKVFTGNELALEVDLKANNLEQPEVVSLTYNLQKSGKRVLDVQFQRNPEGTLDLSSQKIKFTRRSGRVWPLSEPDKFYRISEQSIERFKNAGFLEDFAFETEKMLSSFFYLGPLRERPRRTYQWSGDTPADVGQRGENAISAVLAATRQGRKLNRGPKMTLQSFEEFIASWLQGLGVIHSFVVNPVAKGRKEYEVLIKTHAKSSEVKITDVGFGISQVLPAIVESFYCPPNSVVWMEQPEIHLHTQVQAELADVFISAIKAKEGGKDRNIQLIIESHSEHFLNRLQRRVAEGVVKTEDVAIYFCTRVEGVTTLEPLKLSKYGDIENWPDNFFGDEMDDITARTIAAEKAQKKN